MAAQATSDFDPAAREVQEAAAEAERADDAMTQSCVYGWAAIFGAVRRDGPLTGLNARRLLKLVADTGAAHLGAGGGAIRALVTINVGRRTVLRQPAAGRVRR